MAEYEWSFKSLACKKYYKLKHESSLTLAPNNQIWAIAWKFLIKLDSSRKKSQLQAFFLFFPSSCWSLILKPHIRAPLNEL